mmetsp:Transcript_205/g.408  ORF Transcript_205/g.408 Transcript_205/m.408 type:complete len:174 (+) Transcript_205:172-693(+)
MGAIQSLGDGLNCCTAVKESPGEEGTIYGHRVGTSNGGVSKATMDSFKNRLANADHFALDKTSIRALGLKLQHMTRAGYVEEVENLLSAREYGMMVDVDYRDERKGNTALHIACDTGDAPVVECLVRRGANVTLRNLKELTPAETAEARGHVHLLPILTAGGAVPEPAFIPPP